MNTTILYPHISLNVSNLNRSKAFYEALFDTKPIKERPGYAKFELQNPKLNFAINERPTAQHSNENVINHFGFQVETTDDVLAMQLRLKKVGLATTSEEKVTCCYAVQDKTWVQDPDGVNWEVFAVLADSDSYTNKEKSSVACCAPEVISISTFA